MRNKHLEGVSQFGPGRTLLFVHGATYPASTTFDMPLGGKSWMDVLAERGFDVYLLDLPGYGRSTRPKEMDQPPADNPPLVTTDVAIRCVGAVVDHILQRKGIEKIDLLGWEGERRSWPVMQDHNAKVNDSVYMRPCGYEEHLPIANA
jgi:pimeloyl-ACP methyl ester carboxylesterase